MEGPTVSQEDQDTITELLDKLKHLEVLKGTEHPESISTVRALGEIYYRTRQFELADRMFYRAFCGAERTHRKTHIIVYRVASIYGCLLIDTRKFDKAEIYLRKALVGLEGHLGLDHVDLLESMEGLGECLYINKRQHLEFLQESELLFQRALAMRIKNFGKDDKLTLRAVNNVAKTLNALGRFDAAIVICQDIYDDCVTLLGPLHPITLGAIEGLAFVLQAIGQYSRAMEMYRMSFAGNDSVLGKYHRSTIASLQHLAYLLQLSGTQTGYAEAEKHYIDALERTQIVEGENHPATLSIMFKIGYLRKLQEKLVAAEEVLREARLQRNREIGVLHPDTLCTTLQLASVLYLQGLWKHVYGFQDKLKEGFAFYEECIDKREKSLGLNHLDTIFAVSEYANCLVQQQQNIKGEYWFSVACRKLDVVIQSSLNPTVGEDAIVATSSGHMPDHSHTLRTVQQWEIEQKEHEEYEQEKEEEVEDKARDSTAEERKPPLPGYVYVLGIDTQPPVYPVLVQARPYSPTHRAVSPFRQQQTRYTPFRSTGSRSNSNNSSTRSVGMLWSSGPSSPVGTGTFRATGQGTGANSPIKSPTTTTAVGGRPLVSGVVRAAAARTIPNTSTSNSISDRGKLKPVPVPEIDHDHPSYVSGQVFNYYKYAASCAVRHGEMLQKLDRQPEAAQVYKYALDLYHYYKCITYQQVISSASSSSSSSSSSTEQKHQEQKQHEALWGDKQERDQRDVKSETGGDPSTAADSKQTDDRSSSSSSRNSRNNRNDSCSSNSLTGTGTDAFSTDYDSKHKHVEQPPAAVDSKAKLVTTDCKMSEAGAGAGAGAERGEGEKDCSRGMSVITYMNSVSNNANTGGIHKDDGDGDSGGNMDSKDSRLQQMASASASASTPPSSSKQLSLSLSMLPPMAAPKQVDLNSDHIDILIHETLALYTNAMFMQTL